MRKSSTLLFLGVMVLGLGLTALGTRETRAPAAIQCVGDVCYLQVDLSSCVGQVCHYTVATKSSPDLTLNYIGGVMALLGAVAFGMSFPVRRSNSLRVLPIQLR